jgi:HK97 family phage major capsid protein
VSDTSAARSSTRARRVRPAAAAAAAHPRPHHDRADRNSDQVKFARQTTFTNVAAETAEATATSVGTKPEATIAFEVVTADVKTIAHWVPATRRSLSDAGQLRTLIESQLAYGLEYRLESEVVNGDGPART